jgi:glycosyltransferase involved in cell wall biosynthesis
MEEKINILYFIDYLYGWSGGGTETHLSNLTHLLDKKIFECLIVAFDTGDTPLTKKIKENGIEIIHLPVGRFYTPNALRQALRISRVIRKRKIDLVQTFHFKSDTYGVLTAKMSGVKKIVSSRRDLGDLEGRKSKYHFWLKKLINRYVDGFIVVSDSVGRVVAKKEKVPVHKIKTIYNGVDIDKFAPPSGDEYTHARRELGIGEDDFVIGMVAVFRQEKNHDILFKANEKARQSINGLKLITVGGGHLMGHYKEYCRKSGLIGKVIFTGPTSDVKQYLAAFDVACLVSGSEGFSNSILEKMAMGLPLIVTDVGGNAEAVRDGYNGIVIPPRDADALATALVKMHRDPEKRKQMGRKSRQRAEHEFRLGKMIKNYEQYYQVVIESR